MFFLADGNVAEKKIRESSREEYSGQNVVWVLNTDSVKKDAEHPLFANPFFWLTEM